MALVRNGRLRAMVTAMALSGLIMSGCSSDSDKMAAARPVPSTNSSTTAPSGSESPSSTQTTAAGTNLSKGPPYDRGNGPSGSGCTPADPGKLATGWWAGKITNVQGSTTFDFDLVCWFAGQAAIKAGGEDDAGPVEDDYYVRNSDPRPVLESFGSATAPATCAGDANEPFQCTVGDVLALYASGQPSGTINGRQVTAFSTVWIHVTGESPDYLYMQFTP